jgi:hypothetical protein
MIHVRAEAEKSIRNAAVQTSKNVILRIDKRYFMGKDEFKVVMSQKGSLVFVLTCIVVEVGFVINFFFFKGGLAGIVGALLIFVIFFADMLMSMLYYVKVEAKRVTGRTRFGRRYGFNISEIQKVACTFNYGSHGSRSEIIVLSTNKQKIYIYSTMDGFQKMAEYIIAQHDSGEINEMAVSDSCKRKLYVYKNGAIFKKKIKKHARKE